MTVLYWLQSNLKQKHKETYLKEIDSSLQNRKLQHRILNARTTQVELITVVHVAKCLQDFELQEKYGQQNSPWVNHIQPVTYCQ